MSDRVRYVDIVAGIMILWMIVQHAIQSAWFLDPCQPTNFYGCNPNVWFPYVNFFMPWFFYKSGYFFKKDTIKKLWQKDWNKLIKVLIIWSAIGYLCYILLGCITNTITLHDALYTPTRRFFLTGYIAMNAPLWFLLTLVGVRFVSNIILPCHLNKWSHHLQCLIIVMVSSLIAFSDHVINCPLIPRWVANGASGLAFFTLGYWLRDYEQELALIILAILGYAYNCFFGWNIVNMHLNVLMEGCYILWFPAALCGIVLFNNVFRVLCEWMGKKYPPPLFVLRFVRNDWQICHANIRNAFICTLPDTHHIRECE